MKKWIALLSFALLLLGAGTALAKGDTLIVALPSDAKTLDPHMTPESSSNGAMRQIYESLVQFDGNNELVPVLCEKWEVMDNGRAYKFYLRKGVKFHNGETMTADDVIYSFQRATSPISALRSLSAYIDPKGLEKVDDYTVIVRTTEPIGAAFLASMNHPWASIVSKKAIEAAGKDYGMNPVGTGKFKFVSWTKGDRINYERFDEYWGEKAKLKKLILRTVVENSSRTIELESGAVHVIQDMAAVDVKRITDNKNLMVSKIPGQRTYYLGFDVNIKPYNDVRVRQAIDKVVNRKGIIRSVYKGYALPSSTAVSPAVKYSTGATTPMVEVDVAGAKKLMAEAGHANGFSMELLCPDRTDFIGIATILQSDLAKIGIKAEIKVYEWGAYIDVIKKPGHSPFLMNWWGGGPALDSFFFTTPLFHSKSPASTNRFFYKNPELDVFLDKGAALQDGPERAEAYAKAQEILRKELPLVPICVPDTLRGATKNLRGVTFTPGFIVYYGDAYFE